MIGQCTLKGISLFWLLSLGTEAGCTRSLAVRSRGTCGDITSRCRRTVNDKVHVTTGRRAAAELGRYTYVGCGGISLGELEARSVLRTGTFTAAPADRASNLPAPQRTGNACCDTSRDSRQQRCSARESVPGSSPTVRSSPLVNRQVLEWGSFRAFSNPQGITSRCRRTVNDKVHTSRRQRAAAELGR
jgi:hypothetical protein